MYFDIRLQDHNFMIKLENSSLKIISGNWGIFEKSFSNHMHSYYELHYVTGGQGTLITDTFDMPLSKGCFYLLPPKTNHEQLSKCTDFLKEYHLSFELISYSESDFIWRHLLKNGFYSTTQNDLDACFEKIVYESKNKQYGYLDQIYQSIQSVFIVLMRSIVKHIENALTPATTLDDKRIMLIDDAFLYNYETVSLSSLSNQLKLSARQTQRFIKKKYGVPFSILKYREKLSHAALLLSTTNLSADEICLQIGYKDYASFCRMFKKHYKVSPLIYRKSNTNKNQ